MHKKVLLEQALLNAQVSITGHYKSWLLNDFSKHDRDDILR